MSPMVLCFTAGTLVHTKESLRPIEQIQVGDWMLSKPESGEGEQACKRVTRTIKRENKAVYRVRVSSTAKTIGDVRYIRSRPVREYVSQNLIVTDNSHQFGEPNRKVLLGSVLDLHGLIRKSVV